MLKLKNIFIVIVMLSTLSLANQNLSIDFGGDETIEVEQYLSNGKDLLIMLPSEHGITDGLKELATSINKKNVEVWLADPFGSLFLVPAPSSLKKIPLQAYESIINKAQKTGKNIYLFSNDKGSSLLLKAINNWQSASNSIISGVILVSPNLYKKTPNAGVEGTFLPIASSTNLPIFIYLPEKSTLALRVNDTVEKLKKGGSDVFVQILKNVRDRFFFREDALKDEISLKARFGLSVVNSMKQLKKYAKPRDAVKLVEKKKKKVKTTTNELNEYNGTLHVKDFKLSDLKGKEHTLSQYKGKVVLLNFWASWCPPCIKEIPSMSNLNSKLKNAPFKILAVNLGETKDQMSEFIKKYRVNFTILLDPNQSAPKDYKVFAFPTSYIIDKKGKIRYSIAGGFDWDTAYIKDLITKLANEVRF